MADDHPLVRYRQQQSLTQARLGALLGVTDVTVSRWENGIRKIDQNKLSEVARLTGIPARDLRPDLAELMASEAAQ